jgi:hypothetical protein
MKTTHCLMIALLAASPVAFAQVSGNLNATGSAGINNATPSLPPTAPLPPDQSMARNPNANGTVNGNVNANGLANPNANANAAAQAQGVNAQANSTMEATTVLSPPATVHDIQSTSFNERNPLLNEVSNRIEGGHRLISSLKSNPKATDAETRTEFKSALDDVKAKERILRRSLKEARNASNADAWTVAQGTLAADYEAYATAVTALNAIIQG